MLFVSPFPPPPFPIMQDCICCIVLDNEESVRFDIESRFPLSEIRETTPLMCATSF